MQISGGKWTMILLQSNEELESLRDLLYVAVREDFSGPEAHEFGKKMLAELPQPVLPE